MRLSASIPPYAFRRAVMIVNYEGRIFRPVSHSPAGDVDDRTVFRYHQEGAIVWATYAGGSVAFGTLIAKVDDRGHLQVRYQHLAADGEYKTRRGQSRAEILSDGRVRLYEQWWWTSGAEGHGASVVEEVVEPPAAEEPAAPKPKRRRDA